MGNGGQSCHHVQVTKEHKSEGNQIPVTSLLSGSLIPSEPAAIFAVKGSSRRKAFKTTRNMLILSGSASVKFPPANVKHRQN